MRYVVGIVMGFVSGLLIYFILALTFFGISSPLPGWLVPVGFLGGWVVSSWLFVRKTTTAGWVASRGFLFGTGEWIVMILACFVAYARGLAQVDAASPQDRYAAIASGVAVESTSSLVMVGVVSAIFAVICFVGYLVTKRLRRANAVERALTSS